MQNGMCRIKSYFYEITPLLLSYQKYLYKLLLRRSSIWPGFVRSTNKHKLRIVQGVGSR